MAELTFVPDPNAGHEMARSLGWATHVRRVAQETSIAAKIAFEAQGPHPYSTAPQHYVDMIEGELVVVDGVIGGRVTAYADYSWYIEVGTSDTPTFAPLQKGADMMGLRLEGRPHGRR